MIYAALDPGREGALALITSQGKFKIFLFPKVGKKIDDAGIAHVLKKVFTKYTIKHLIIEDVHSIPRSAAKANFEFGRAKGFLEGYIYSKEIPFTEIAPKEWQREMFKGVNIIKKTKRGKVYKRPPNDTKAMAKVAVQRLFPGKEAKFLIGTKKEQEGAIDALLMAEYCRRKF